MSSSEDRSIPDYDEALTLLARATLPPAQPAPGLPPTTENGEPPEETRKWNWGAFLGNFLWCKYHGMAPAAWIFLTVAILGVALGALAPGLIGLIAGAACLASLIGLSAYLGAFGGALAWENRRFDGGAEQFAAVQRRWALYGTAGFGAVCALFAGVLLFDALGRATTGAGTQAADSRAAAAMSPLGDASLTAAGPALRMNGVLVSPRRLKGAPGHLNGAHAASSLYPTPITPVYEPGNAAPAPTRPQARPAAGQQPADTPQTDQPPASNGDETSNDESAAQQAAPDMQDSGETGQSGNDSQSAAPPAESDSSATSPPASNSSTGSDQPASGN